MWLSWFTFSSHDNWNGMVNLFKRHTLRTVYAMRRQKWATMAPLVVHSATHRIATQLCMCEVERRAIMVVCNAHCTRIRDALSTLCASKNGPQWHHLLSTVLHIVAISGHSLSRLAARFNTVVFTFSFIPRLAVDDTTCWMLHIVCAHQVPFARGMYCSRRITDSSP